MDGTNDGTIYAVGTTNGTTGVFGTNCGTNPAVCAISGTTAVGGTIGGTITAVGTIDGTSVGFNTAPLFFACSSVVPKPVGTTGMQISHPMSELGTHNTKRESHVSMRFTSGL